MPHSDTLSAADAWSKAHQGLRQLWGYEHFREPQGEIVTGLLRGQDTVVMLPTGAGKSLCFQLPASLCSGLTVVVSPLVSLMENQVQALRQRQQPAACLHSQMSARQRRQTLQQLERLQLQLLYVSPESLLSPPIWQRLDQPHQQLRFLIVDEAHCIGQWGTSFRPAYRRLGAVRSALSGASPTIAAFTATADPATRRDIETTLCLQRPHRVIRSPYRSNLHVRVQVTCSPALRRRLVLAFLRAQGETTGLIYTRSRRDSEQLAAWLSARQVPVVAYHAGLVPEQRRQIETAWLTGAVQGVVCTSAFGMGINQPHVRWVCHFHPPLTLTEYVQEIGRAGRDGLPAVALLLVSEPTGWLDPHDQRQRRYFTDQLQRQQRQARRFSQHMPPAGDIRIIAQQWPQAEMALALLHSMGQVRWQDPFHYRLSNHGGLAQGRTPDHPALNNVAMRAMVQYIRTRSCRWQKILQLFGFPAEAASWRCNHCDRCCPTIDKCAPA